MKRDQVVEHEFVEYVPEKLKENVLYISLKYLTVNHKCVCGCGKEVVTPLSPTGWSIMFDGKTISLSPSIGNWDFSCQSHYWIKNGKAKWIQDQQTREIKSKNLWSRLKRQFQK